MPNFKIRRKKRDPEPEPVVTEVAEPAQPSAEEDDALIDECLGEIRESTPQYTPPPRQYQRKPHQRNPYPVRFADPPVEPVEYYPPSAYHTPERRQYIGQPSMRVPPNKPMPLQGRRKIRFRSHYGMDGDQLDTHTKSRLLL